MIIPEARFPLVFSLKKTLGMNGIISSENIRTIFNNNLAKFHYNHNHNKYNLDCLSDWYIFEKGKKHFSLSYTYCPTANELGRGVFVKGKAEKGSVVAFYQVGDFIWIFLLVIRVAFIPLRKCLFFTL